jgi:group I intron endonuclease
MDQDSVWTGATGSPRQVVCGVYVFTHVTTGKIYVGSTFHFYKRRRQHFHALTAGRHHNRYLQNLFNKDPRFHVEFFLVDTSTTAKDRRERAFQLEQEIINRHRDSGHLINFQTDVKRTMFGVEFTAEHRANMSRARKGIIFSDEHKQKLSAWQRGRQLSPEWIQKVVDSNRGKKRTPEQRARIADSIRLARKNPKNADGFERAAAASRKRVSIDGVVYPSMKAAGEAIGMHPTNVKMYIRTGKRPNWFQIDE